MKGIGIGIGIGSSHVDADIDTEVDEACADVDADSCGMDTPTPTPTPTCVHDRLRLGIGSPTVPIRDAMPALHQLLQLEGKGIFADGILRAYLLEADRAGDSSSSIDVVEFASAYKELSRRVEEIDAPEKRRLALGLLDELLAK